MTESPIPVAWTGQPRFRDVCRRCITDDDPALTWPWELNFDAETVTADYTCERCGWAWSSRWPVPTMGESPLPRHVPSAVELARQPLVELGAYRARRGRGVA